MGHQIKSFPPGVSRLQAPAPRRVQTAIQGDTIAKTEIPFEELPAVAIPISEDEDPFASPFTGIARSNTVDDQDADELDVVPLWYEIYRSLPSWLTSLVVHLAIILTLALLSFSTSQRGTVELVASTIDANQPILSLNVLLDPDDESSETEVLESKIQESVEPEPIVPVIDHSLLTSSLDSVEFGDPFESISRTGVSDDQSGPASNNRADFFGITGDGSNFVFIIDCSGSMAEYGRWRRAVKELKKSVVGLTDKQKFLIILYNDGHISMNMPPAMISATAKNKDAALQWLTANRPEGWTFCGDAMLNAILQQPDAIFLLSDGEFNDRRHVFNVLEKNNSTKNKNYKQIPVHTIALGSHRGKWTMKKIADDNNGIYMLIVD